MLVFTATPGTESHDKLALLGVEGFPGSRTRRSGRCAAMEAPCSPVMSRQSVADGHAGRRATTRREVSGRRLQQELGDGDRQVDRSDEVCTEAPTTSAGGPQSTTGLYVLAERSLELIGLLLLYE